MEKISSNAYVQVALRGCNHSFVVTGERVVMVDTPMMPADAAKWRDEIGTEGSRRVKELLISYFLTEGLIQEVIKTDGTHVEPELLGKGGELPYIETIRSFKTQNSYTFTGVNP